VLGPAPRAGCMRCSSNWFRAESPRKSRSVAPRRSSPASRRAVPSKRPVTTRARTPRGSPPGRGTDTGIEASAHRSRGSLGNDRQRSVRVRTGRHRDRDRPHPQHRPVPEPRPLRRIQQHRPDRDVVRRPRRAPAVATREPPTQHAIHIAAITQIRHPHSPGRGYYDRKLAEGKTTKEAIRALKRRISDALYQRLQADAAKTGPGGQAGTTQSSVTGIAPRTPALRKSHSRTQTNGYDPPRAHATTDQTHPNALLTTKRRSIRAGLMAQNARTEQCARSRRYGTVLWRRAASIRRERRAPSVSQGMTNANLPISGGDCDVWPCMAVSPAP